MLKNNPHSFLFYEFLYVLNIFVTVHFYSLVIMLKFTSYFQWVTDSLVLCFTIETGALLLFHNLKAGYLSTLSNTSH